MEKQFVTYEIALKLKELGFDEECLAWYLPEIYIKDNICTPILGAYCRNWSSSKDRLNCPLYQQVTDWFREKHNIHIEVELTDNTMQFYYQYCIVDSKNREHHDEDMIDQATRIYNYNERFNTYEETREQAILKAIELCKKQ